MPETARPTSAFEGLTLPSAGSRFAAEPAGALVRFVLRAREAGVGPLGAAVGVALPREACRSASADGRHALWLGPDEWLLLAPEAARDAILAATAALAEPVSVVEVTNRNAGILVTGSKVTDVLAAGCPLDLDPSAFPIGMSTRTLYQKAEIVLWRTGAHAFHVEAWRSFVPYVVGVMAEAAREHQGR